MHPSNVFRTSNTKYTSRPAANRKAARLAWDELSMEGPVLSMRLLAGLWMCERSEDPLAPLDHIEAVVIARMVESLPIMRRAALAYRKRGK